MTSMATIISLCVYCGSSDRGPQAHHDAALRLGRIMAKAGIRLVYGGGRIGMMGRVADAVMESGGEAIGIIPQFLEQVEIGHSGVSQLIVTDNMHDRKQKMAELSDAFLIMPGGLGTLEEAFEILTWKQLGLHQKPIIIANIGGYWRHLTQLIDHMIATSYARPEHRALFQVIDSVDELLPTLAAMPEYDRGVEAKWL